MYSGSNGVSQIGNLRIINGLAEMNKLAISFNGTGLINVTESRPLNENTTLSDIRLKNVNYGMQFPPNMGQDALKVFNDRSYKADKYEFDTEQTLGDNDLSLYQFQGEGFAGDMLFASNLRIYEEPYGCYQCEQKISDNRDLTVNGTQISAAPEAPKNYIRVQPDTGYLYEKQRASTVFMTIGGKQMKTPPELVPTPFENLDPLYGVAFPLYDLQESLVANQDTFTSKFDYVSSTRSQVRGLVISFSIFAALFLILGIVACVVDKLRGGDNKSRDELLERHMDRD